MILRPTGRILIQKAGVVAPSGDADFFVLPLPDITGQIGLVSACKVEFATSAQGPGVVATFNVNNLHPKTVREMAQGGYVKIEAGYLGHPSRSPQILFFGKLDKAKYTLESGQISWAVSASAFPNDIWAVLPNVGLPTGQDGKPAPILIGEAIRIIADRIGINRANVRLPKIFDGDLSETEIKSIPNLSGKVTDNFRNAITLQNWTTTRKAIIELSELCTRVSKAVQETFGVARRYSLLPNVNDPFIVVIGDLDRFSGESLSIDLDSSQIMSAAPDESNVNVPPSEPATTEADESGSVEPATVQATVQEYKITSVFDPKISMGLLIHAESKKYDLKADFRVSKGQHILNGSPLKWRTEYGGQLEVDVEAPRA